MTNKDMKAIIYEKKSNCGNNKKSLDFINTLGLLYGNRNGNKNYHICYPISYKPKESWQFMHEDHSRSETAYK